MKKVKVFLAEDFQGTIHYSLKSHDDIMSNTTVPLMPGGFKTVELSNSQIKKLESDAAYFLKSTASGLTVQCN